LVFTAIPYWLVVGKVVAGTALLAIILFFAVLQMIVQVVFFLHLGRERKPRWQLYFFLGTVFGIMTVVVGSIFIMNHLHKNMSPESVSKYLAEKEGISQLYGEKTGACKGRQASHKVTIRDGKVTPQIIIARHCDSLIFINEDSEVREITFGTHPEHGSYAGESEMSVRKGRSKSIVLNELGSYRFHDHLDPEINGYFTVSQ
jgi:cytochrome o ubiquinol oxidase operon protein cyoD